MRRLILAAIRFYQTAISPLRGPTCRFLPTCSQYTLEAIERYGTISGCWRGLKRVLRCHPCSHGGYDPLP